MVRFSPERFGAYLDSLVKISHEAGCSHYVFVKIFSSHGDDVVGKVVIFVNYEVYFSVMLLYFFNTVFNPEKLSLKMR
jgi:hypothetical protein